MSDDTKIINIGEVKKMREEEKKANKVPTFTYVLINHDGEEFVDEGYLIFTAQHVAVMRDLGDIGSVPATVMPLTEVKIVQVVNDDEEQDTAD